MYKLRFLLFFILLWCATPTRAFAHAELIDAYPAPDETYPVDTVTQLSLSFDEVVDVQLSSVKVYTSELSRVDKGALVNANGQDKVLLVYLEDLPPGTYTVVWQVVSKIDGHATTGLFAFNVGEKTQKANIAIAEDYAQSFPGWEISIRWLMFLSGFAVFGAFFSNAIIFTPYFRSVGQGVDNSVSRRIERLLKRVIGGASIVLLLAGFVQMILQVSTIIEASLAGAVALWLQSRFGTLWLLRQVIIMVLWRLHDRKSTSLVLLKLVLAAGILGTFSLSSHSAAAALWPGVGAAVDALHLIANAAWIGSLMMLSITMPFILGPLSPPERRYHSRALLVPFSRSAFFCALIAATTGAYSATLLVLSPQDLLSSAYGKALILKSVLVGMVLFLGFINAVFLKPKWMIPSMAFKSLNRWRGKFMMLIRLETGIALGVLLVTASLTALPTPAPKPLPEGQFFHNSKLSEIFTQDGLRVFVSIAPNWTGWNRYLVALQDTEGHAITEVERVRLRFTLPQSDVRTPWVMLAPVQDGLFVSEGSDLVLEGRWQIEIDIRRASLDSRVSFDWPMEAFPTLQIDPAEMRISNVIALILVGMAITGTLLGIAQRYRRARPAAKCFPR